MKTKINSLITAILMIGLLNGCDKVSPTNATFRIMLTNLSANQPMSPLGVIVHNGGYQAWSIGTAASIGLEELAEGGDNTTFLTEAANNGYITQSTSGVLLPGMTDVIDIEVDLTSVDTLSAATMLVNTNDAFTGLTGVPIAMLAKGESISHYMPIYDAGTEFNTEANGTIPGPANGGEGFNVTRDDVDFVARHPGVVSTDDGYADSVLNSSHRFDAPAAKMVIMRL